MDGGEIMYEEENNDWLDDLESEHQNDLTRADEDRDDLKNEILTDLFEEQ